MTTSFFLLIKPCDANTRLKKKKDLGGQMSLALFTLPIFTSNDFQTQGRFYLQSKRFIDLILSFAKCNGVEVCFIRISRHVLLHNLGGTLLKRNSCQKQCIHICKATYLDQICALSMVDGEQFSAIQFIKVLIYLNKTDKMEINGIIATRSLRRAR